MVLPASEESWSAKQYLKFEAQRTRPVVDLLAQVRRDCSGFAVDLGCGPGNSTQALRDHCPDLRILGLDRSPSMIAEARKRLPCVTFEVGSIEEWCGAPSCQVVLANASLQWVPDHDRLFPKLTHALAPGGTLAVQMPDNLDEPAHRAMRTIAASLLDKDIFSKVGVARAAMQTPSWYFELLQPLTQEVKVWRTTYYHVLPDGTKAVVEWFKGSGLRPYLAALGPKQEAEFLERFTTAMTEAYPASINGVVLLPFPRLFIVATR